jgi:pyruvate dehydrogenase E2 component (dihydrolipoamide acetyltransferase)
MAEIVTMPKLGFDMAEGTLVRWVIQEGQPVEKGAVLAEIETDKATVEVESSYSGLVQRHLIEEGTAVPVGDAIAVIGEAGEKIDYQQLLGESSAGAEATAPAAGLTGEAGAARTTAAPREVAAPEVERAIPGDGHLPGGVRASPVARRMAEERGIDLKDVSGSGPGGRITKSDIEAYRLPAVQAEAPASVVPPIAPAALPVTAVTREDRHISRSRLRATIGRRMVESVQTIPHFYVTHEYDVAALLNLRKQVNALLPEGEKISINDFIVKAVALALREFPNLNATVDEAKNEIIQFGHINIGVAVALENGLITVVCRDADVKPARQIALELRTAAFRAREGKVRPADIEGSTFSVSNLGMFDVPNFSAIINPPEAAILAVGTAREVPVVVNGELKPGWRMWVTLSINHRISDGAEAARFLQALAIYLEEPMRLLV